MQSETGKVLAFAIVGAIIGALIGYFGWSRDKEEWEEWDYEEIDVDDDDGQIVMPSSTAKPDIEEYAEHLNKVREKTAYDRIAKRYLKEETEEIAVESSEKLVDGRKDESSTYYSEKELEAVNDAVVDAMAEQLSEDILQHQKYELMDDSDEGKWVRVSEDKFRNYNHYYDRLTATFFNKEMVLAGYDNHIDLIDDMELAGRVAKLVMDGNADDGIWFENNDDEVYVEVVISEDSYVDALQEQS